MTDKRKTFELQVDYETAKRAYHRAGSALAGASGMRRAELTPVYKKAKTAYHSLGKQLAKAHK